MSRKLRVGIIGVNPGGSWGTLAHIPALQALEQIELVALCNRRHEAAAEAAKKFSVPKYYSDLGTMLADPDIDLISVCVRVPRHFELVDAAIDAGKHVYCEWPLAISTAEAEALKQKAKRKGLRHAIGLQARFAPAVTRLKQLIAQGYIGDVVSCTAIHSWPHTTKSAYLQDSGSGATLLTIPGGHTLDAIQHAVGDFQELAALSRTLVKRVRVEDSGEIVERTSHDQIAIHGTLVNGAVVAAQFKTGPSSGTGLRFEVNGTKGDLILTSAGYPPIQMTALTLWETKESCLSEISVPSDDGPLARIPSGRPNNIGRLYAALAHSILTKTPFHPDFETAVQNHRLLDAVRQASETGHRVTLQAAGHGRREA